MAYQLIEQRELQDLQGKGYLYEHTKTKAKVCFIITEDENKTFSISFRTPPSDHTGVPHILEHSVLCGSRKYPVKDPFIELAKGSLNTYLNAATYSDKTMYPVASVNTKDFDNLKDVYMDAVLYPNIYNKPETFMQEGWHYELLEEVGKVEYKGVVYNEMKGVFSSPEQVLFRMIQQELFEGHPYSYESGGDPLYITDLTYENFLDFHRTYYHPSNSYIFYYGQVDRDKELEWLDQQYLSHFDYLPINSAILPVERYASIRRVEASYPIAEGDSLTNKAFLSYNVVTNADRDRMKSLGFTLLEYLLVDAPGAPIKEALLRKGLCEDVFGSYDSSIREGTFSFVGKNCDENREEEFISTIEEVLRTIVAHGFEGKKLQAAINKFEFRAKEADFGQYPKGVVYAVNALETWLYDESPFTEFEYSQLFEQIKKEVQGSYLQDLISEFLLDNTHKVFLKLLPSTTYAKEVQEKVDRRLSEYESSLDKEKRSKLIELNQELIRNQEEPDREEDLVKLPLLNLTDIARDKKKLEWQDFMAKDAKILYHHANASDIAYAKIAFDVSFVEEENLPILSLLSRLLGKLSTKVHHYSELSDEINGRTGGISISLNVYEHKASSKYYAPVLEIQGKSFVANVSDLYELMAEILTMTDFSDLDRMKDLIGESKSRLQMNLKSSGHATSIGRAISYFSKAGAYKEKIKGLSFYEELSKYKEWKDEQILELGQFMKRILEEIVTSDGMTVALTSRDDYQSKVLDATKRFIYSLPNQSLEKERVDIECIEPSCEGFKTTQDIHYVAIADDYKNYGFTYHGSMKVLNTILSLDYLWNNVRIKGGAYGAFASISMNGLLYFGSYRDPNLADTLEVYRSAGEFIDQLELSERELTKYIIGTISNLDQPLTPSLENEKMMNLYFTEVSHEEILKNRQEILDTTVDEISKYADMLKQIFATPYLCVVGKGETIEANAQLFNEIKTLS